MGKTSLVWNYFNGTEELGVFSCSICKKCVKSTDSSTSNLRHHLRTYHPQEHVSLYPSSSGSRGTDTPSQTSSSATYSRSDKRWEELTRAVTFCIAKDAMPLRTVEKPGFRHLVKKLDPRFEAPSERALSKTHIPKLYNETRQKVIARLKDATFFSATTDMWSSQSMLTYMGLTVHFIDSEWKLAHIDLGTRFVPEDHTAETLAEAIKDMLDQWGLSPSKLVCITTDNGANVVQAMRDLGWVHMCCFGHGLHLGITKSYSSNTSLAVAHNLVAKFNTSWRKTRDLQVAQVLNGKEPKCLISDCRTRWGSTHAMLKRILENEEEIRQVLVNDENFGKNIHLVPKRQDVAAFEALNKVMEPMLELTDIMLGSKYVTLSCLKPLLEKLEREVLAPAEMSEKEPNKDQLLANILRQNILDDILPRYADDDKQNLIIITSFLDPRFKVTHLDDNQSTAVKTTLLTLCREESLPQTTEHLSTSTDSAARGDDPSPQPSDYPPRKKQRTLGSWLGKRKEQLSSPAQSSPRDNFLWEYDLYVAIPCADCEDDPLEWWKDHEKNFPNLAPFARRYLSVQATSSPSERLFSEAGQIITPMKTQLNPEKANMLIFLAHNL